MSGRVRDAFTARGHDAVSCDILPSLTPGNHYQGDIRDLLGSESWDLMIAFPPCTDLSVVCAKDWPAKQADGRQGRALAFVQMLMDAPIQRVAIENPVGRINTAIRKPDQIINPYQFGDPWKKRTCLWLKGLPLLVATEVVEPKGHWVDGGSRVAHKDREFGDAKFGSKSSEARSKQRNLTFPGIARAMAEQWG